MNLKNSKAYGSLKLLLSFSDKMCFENMLFFYVINVFFYQILAYTIHEKNIKSHTKTINLKFPDQHGMQNLNYLMDHILYQIFKIILNISSKNMKQ